MTRVPIGPSSTARTSEEIICACVTSPNRSADSRFDGIRSKIQYSGNKTAGHQWPGPSTYHGRRIVTGMPVARNAASASTARLDVGVHHRRGMRHADVDDVRNAGARRGARGDFGRGEIDFAKLPGLAWIGARRANQMHQRVTRRQRLGKVVCRERVANDLRHFPRERMRGSGPDERLHPMAALLRADRSRRAQDTRSHP